MYLTDKLKKNIFLGLCVIIAVALNYFESVLMMGSAIPGIKIGISNIVVLTVIYMYSYKEGIMMGVLKSVLISLLFTNGLSFIYSFLGGVFSAFGMGLFKRAGSLSCIGVSIIGSFIHITVQIITAFFILNSKAVFYYYPYMLLVSSIAGFINGYIVKSVLNKLRV